MNDLDKSVYLFISSTGKRAILNYSMAAGMWLIQVEDRFDDVFVGVYHSSRKTLASAIEAVRKKYPNESWEEFK